MFTGEYFEGGYWYPIYGTKKDIPVFAKAGAIIPLNGDEPENGVSLPKTLCLKVFPGENSEFSLYEDDGESQRYLDGASAITLIKQETRADLIELLIAPTSGHLMDCRKNAPGR
jgi:alpha-glucosidase (family GH31 glycosyl hydrolase)